MAAYTQKNLKDIDSSAPEALADHMEARFGRRHIESEHLGVSYFRFGPDFSAPFGHRHREQEEAYVIASGSGRLRLDDDIVEVRQWDVIRVAPQVVRAFRAGPDGLEVIAIGADRPEGGDGEPVPDFWTD